MVVTGNNNNESRDSTANDSRSTSSSSTQRKSFPQVVKEWTNGLELKSQTKVFQTGALEMMEDTRPYEELKQELNSLKNEQRKPFQDLAIFCCKNGTDDISLQLLKELLEEVELEQQEQHLSQLNKIMDKTSSNGSLMHLCAQRNKPHCMEYLSQHNVPIDSIDSISATPLLYAVAHNCEEAAAFLLSRGANINVKDTYNKFPLLVALKNKHYKMAEMLASYRGIDVHLRGTKGNTVLHFMTEEGDLTACKFLVERLNASPQRRNNDEETVLYTSLPHVEIAHYLSSQSSKKALAKMLVNVNVFGKNLFHRCGSDGHLDTLLLILKNLDLSDLPTNQIFSLLNDKDKNGDTPLILAAKNSRKEFVQFLCQCMEVKINEGDADGNTALYHSVSSKDKHIMSLLKSVGGSLKAESKNEDDEEKMNLMLFLKSLNLTLVLMFSLVAIACTVTIAAIALGFFASNISKTSAEERESSFVDVLQYIDTNIKEHTLVFNTALANVGKNLNTSDSMAVLEFSFKTFNANPQNDLPLTINFYCGNGKGVAGTLLSGDKKSYEMIDSINDTSISVSYRFPNIENTTFEEVINTAPKVISPNVEETFLFESVRASQGTNWTQSYTSPLYIGFLYITLFTPWRDTTNTLTGFCASDIATESLGYFLRNQATKDESLIIIIERQSGYLIGSSVLRASLYLRDGEDVIRYDGTENKHRDTTKMVNYARKNYGGNSLSQVGSTPIYTKFRMYGREYALNLCGYKDVNGLDWVVLQSVPLKVFYKHFYNSLIVMFCVTAILIVFFIGVSIFAAYLFMRPLKSLVYQAESIKMLQIEEVEKSLNSGLSYFTEIRSLQQSFKSMAARIKQFRQFIPDHILAVIETEVIHKAIFVQIQKEKNGSGKSSKNSADILMKTHSDSISDTRGTSTSTNFNSRGMVSNALTSGLSSGSLTVMTVQFPDFTDLLETYSASDLSETSRDMLNALKDCIRESNGQLVHLNSTNSVIVWNSFIGQSDHRHRACRTARNCLDIIQKLQKRWSDRGLPLLHIQIGISGGTTYFGNIGSDATKFFTVIGKPVNTSARLCSMNSEWGTRIICSDDIEDRVKEDFHLRPINKIEDGVYVYELGDAKNAEEWANDMNHDRVSSIWHDYNKAYGLMDKGDYEEAYITFSRYLSKHPYDVPTQKLTQLCREQAEAMILGGAPLNL